MSLPPLATINGIEKIFHAVHQGLAADSAISQQGVQAIIKHYDYLSKQKYGFEVSPKNSIDRLGFYLLERSEKEGLAILKKILKRYPQDAYSHHNLAKAHTSMANYPLAVQHQQAAVNIADIMQTWHKKRHLKFLAQYQQ